MFGRTFPSGIHYTSRGTQCYGNVGNVVPGAAHRIYAQRKQVMSLQVLNRDVRHAKDRSEDQHCKSAPSTLCYWEGATLWLIDGYTGSHRGPPVSSLPLIFTLTCTASPQLWLSPWTARGSEKQEVILSAWSPISSLIDCQPRVWLQAKLITTKQLSLAASTTTSTHTQFRGCHTRAHAHTVRRNRM